MRTLHLTNPLMKGADVSYVQRLLVGVKLMTSAQVDGEFGPGTGAACVAIKKRLGYPLKDCIPTAGDTLVGYLTGKIALPLAYRIRRAQRGGGGTGPTTTELKQEAARAASVKWWTSAVANNGPYHYGQVRPIQFLWNPWLWACLTDCSGSATKGAKSTNYMPDPNGPQGGREWSGLGYTGTMLSHCTHISSAMAKPGDYVVFGPFPGHHVVTLIERLDGSDWKVGSHGQEGDPRFTTLSREASYQPAPVTFLSAF